MEIYLQTGNEPTGPYREEDVRAMVTAGKVARNDLAWREGMSEWQPVDQVVDLPDQAFATSATQGIASLERGAAAPRPQDLNGHSRRPVQRSSTFGQRPRCAPSAA